MNFEILNPHMFLFSLLGLWLKKNLDTCNKEAKSLQQILMQGTLNKEFIDCQMEKYCKHSQIISKFDPEAHSKISENHFPPYFVLELKQIFNNQSHGVLHMYSILEVFFLPMAED